jgi:hypothetical protein
MTRLNQSLLVETLTKDGFLFIEHDSTLELLQQGGPPADWAQFTDSFNKLEVDRYMADAGRYRRRRHATFNIDGASITRNPHRPHFQSTDYNQLNGGIERWYTPIDADLASGASVTSILAWCHATFSAVHGRAEHWLVELHQFRIEASAQNRGLPTPEGMHRDGVDYVLVLLVTRHNVASGTTLIGGRQGPAQGSFTLTAPFDAVMLDDHRVYHGVTAIEPLDLAHAGYRDVLVVTFRARQGVP